MEKIVLKKYFVYGKCGRCGKLAHFANVCKKISMKPRAQQTCSQFFNKLKQAGLQFSVNVINQDNQTHGSQQRPPKQRGSNPKTRKPTKTQKGTQTKETTTETDTGSPWTRRHCECYSTTNKIKEEKEKENTVYTYCTICQRQCT